MNDLESAIKHCEKKAEEQEMKARMFKSLNDYERSSSMQRATKECEKCASEHRQLVEWLKALKEIWDSGDCNDCRNGQCEWKPKLGELVRFNCPHYVGVANEEVNAKAESEGEE